MICPACDRNLSPVKVGELSVDICSTGCGGVWFDKGELQTLEQSPNIASEHVLRPVRNSAVVIDHSRERLCPRDRHKLSRVYDRGHADLYIDECNTCDGIWLDSGELAEVLTVNRDQEEQQRIIESVRVARPRMAAVLRLLFEG